MAIPLWIVIIVLAWKYKHSWRVPSLALTLVALVIVSVSVLMDYSVLSTVGFMVLPVALGLPLSQRHGSLASLFVVGAYSLWLFDSDNFSSPLLKDMTFYPLYAVLLSWLFISVAPLLLLRALMDWSYDLLTEPERALLARLSVFAGGWTLETAEAVGAGEGVEAMDVLDLLTNLVEKSSVNLNAAGERYTMLETVRAYALERLRAASQEGATRTRHLDFFLALAEEAMVKLSGPEQVAWLARLDLERDNLYSAHPWTHDCT